jgi:hypothetical protein
MEPAVHLIAMILHTFTLTTKSMRDLYNSPASGQSVAFK